MAPGVAREMRTQPGTPGEQAPAVPSGSSPGSIIYAHLLGEIHQLTFILGSCGLTPAATFLGYNCIAQMATILTKIYYHEPRAVLLRLLTISKTQKMKETQTNTRTSIESPPLIKASKASGLLNESAQQTQQDGRGLATPF